MNEQQLAKGLGWFSIGLGMTELLAPKGVVAAAGIENDGHDTLVRSLGIREIASGLAILASDMPAEGVWSRVGGDAMDLGLLCAALRSRENQPGKLKGAIAVIAGITAIDLLCGLQLTKQRTAQKQRRIAPGSATYNDSRRRRDSVRHSITIMRPASELYAFWRNFENLPKFMTHLKRVEVQSDTRSHWVAKGPAGLEAEWDAEITDERPGELIAWRSLPGSTIRNRGVVRFEAAPGGRGTIVRVELEYRTPGGAVGKLVAKLLGESPDKQIRVELHRVKQLLETGEIARTRGQPAGRMNSTSRKYDELVRN